jgi:hypothetical protein
MHRQKYHLLLFFLSVPFIFTIHKTWMSPHLSWASEAYPFLVLFAALAEIYFSRRKLVLAGMAGMGIFLLGLVLNIPHWPGARLCVFTGLTVLMVIPLWSAITSRHQKTLAIIISGWILLYGIGALFKIFSWPGGGLIIILSLAGLPVVTIALGISLWKAKQQQYDRNV